MRKKLEINDLLEGEGGGESNPLVGKWSAMLQPTELIIQQLSVSTKAKLFGIQLRIEYLVRVGGR